MSNAEAIREKILAILADRDPALKDVGDYPVLMRRIRVFLDEEDVTGRCRAFSIPGGVVKLYAESTPGKKLLEVVCGCGRTTNPELKAQARRLRVCKACGWKYEWEPVLDLHYGKVEAVPK